MKTFVAAILIACTFMPAIVLAQEPAEKKQPAVERPKAKTRKIAHGGCYYPFPVQANDPKEPIAKEFSLDRGGEYLDKLTRQWNKEVGCVTCHTTLSYFTSRPALKKDSNVAVDELRDFMEHRVANWKTDKPLWDAEVLITAVSMAIHDANTTGKLQPQTRTALEKMWSLQRPNGAWNWLKAGTPPFEHDDYYGAVLVAVGVGLAPENYAADIGIKDEVAKLRQYLTKTPPPSLHHAAWLMWAEAKLGGVMTKEMRDQKIKELTKLQRPDGGWSLPSLGGWKGRDGLPIDQAASDGYGTGLAVFALRQAGVPSDNETIRKGVQWLKANQRESGSWFTGSLGTRYRLNFMSHSGTAFAIMAIKACE
ncbi:MAG: terpene cyclase/mutase family protein [Planctomycetes bacterium]|nr:terpene cyclase/mutase family protein [Planctomycetota bacterium]